MTVEFATQHRAHSRIPAETGKPYFVEQGMGDRAHLFGDLFTIYAGGEQTENTFNFFTCEGPKGDVIPAHAHPNTYEVFYVTSGAVRLFVEDTAGEQYERLLGVGDFGLVPKNCPHSYRIEQHRSRIVGVAAGPGGTFERFFENLGAPTEELGLPREPVVPDPGKFTTVPQHYDVRFLPEQQWRTASFRAEDEDA